MSSSYRLTPAVTTKSASIQDTTSTLGLHDTLQYGPRTLAVEVQSQSGMKERLENWESTQDNLKLTLERNVFGMGLPMRKLMERKLVTSSPNPLFKSHNNLHLDILMGRDQTIDTSDVFLGMESGPALDPHKEIEQALRK